MKIGTRLLTLEMTNELSAAEILIARTWRFSEGDSDISLYANASYVVACQDGLPRTFLTPVRTIHVEGIKFFPVPILGLLTPSVSEGAWFISRTLYTLIMKVLAKTPHGFKGVLSVVGGISQLNGLHPGALIWELAKVPDWRMEVGEVLLNICFAVTKSSLKQTETSRYSELQAMNKSMTVGELLQMQINLFQDSHYAAHYTTNVEMALRTMLNIEHDPIPGLVTSEGKIARARFRVDEPVV